MKTSLNIDDRLFGIARQQSLQTGSSVSELISQWARVGWETLQQKHKAEKKIRPDFKAAHLGGPAKIDLSSRRDWMDALDT